MTVSRHRLLALAGVVVVMVVTIWVKTAIRARESQPAVPPGESAMSSTEGPPGSKDTPASLGAETAVTGTPARGAAASSASSSDSLPGASPPAQKLPKLLELGSVTCHACQQMMPIIEDLKRELRGRVDVEFVDVVKHSEMADKYAIQLIPTQIFLDARGRELFRHVGFYPKEDILAKMKELGMLK
ncbi:MAG: thioredoxin family protein [Armatimonadetes bacterium]|nr:thioredoxin family protein [Armatimonadota bacterium]